jgi:thioredoxin 1
MRATLLPNFRDGAAGASYVHGAELRSTDSVETGQDEIRTPSLRREIVAMTATHDYAVTEPSRSEVDALPGATLLEFGAAWCGYCRRAQPLIDEALANHSGVRHIRIADASHCRLGRSFAVKLWPTLVFLKDGREIARLVRPTDVNAIRKGLADIDPV